MITQKDISAACGLSISTVSKALGDYSDISEETKKRVRDVAKKMGYFDVKNELTIRREHTYTVGLLVTEEMERGSCLNVVQELQKALALRGYDLVHLSPLREDGAAAERPGYLPRARLYGMEGVFLFSNVQEGALYHRDDLRDLRELILGEIPVVAVGFFLASCSCVVPGYEKGIRSLIREIYRRGHRRIAFVFKESTKDYGICKKAIHIALREHNLSVPDHFFCHVSQESGQEAFTETMNLLQGSRWLRPTCILYTDDRLLEEGIAAVREYGLRIPEDISVAAIRISEEQKYRDIPVIGWRIPPSMIAEAAVEQMFGGSKGFLQGIGRVRMIDGTLYDE